MRPVFDLARASACGGALLLGLLACAGPSQTPPQTPPPPASSTGAKANGPEADADATKRFAVYSLWLEGQGEEHRAELDLFQGCLLGQSNFGEFWSPRVEIEAAGSWVVAAPEGLLQLTGDIEASAVTEAWLGPLLAGSSLPAPEPGVTPIYLIYADVSQMPAPICGQCGVVRLASSDAAVAVVRTGPPCWPAQGAVRSLTQYTEHEISGAIELALGQEHCAADGQCQTPHGCPVPDPCHTFTGLFCPGAPEQSYTGCNGTPVRGWVVQKLGHKQPNTEEQGGEQCPDCAACDFTVETIEGETP